MKSTRFRACVGALALVSLCLVSTGAAAATHQARNRCADAVRILRQAPRMSELSRPLDPLAKRGLLLHRNQVIDSWNRASAQINQIPRPELDPNDPELAECFTEVRKWGAYVKELDAQLDAVTVAAASVEPFLDGVKVHKDALWLLAPAHFASGDVLVNRHPQDLGRALAALAEVERACAAQLPGAGAAMPALDHGNGSVHNIGGATIPSTLERKSDAWCFVAKERRALAEKALAQHAFASPGFGNWHALSGDALHHLGRHDTMLDVRVVVAMADPSALVQAMQADVRAWYGAAGLPVPTDATPALAHDIAELRAAATSAVADVRFEDRGLHAASFEALGRAAVTRAEPHAKILATTMDAADYTIEKNVLGVPLDRFRSGRVLVHRQHVDFCEERTFSCVEVYAGGGHYQSAKEAKLTEMTHLVACP